MIKFILHGGKSRIDCKSNRQFYQQLFKLDKKEVNFLVVSFARPIDQQELPKEEINKIIQLNLDKRIDFILAHEERFTKQLEKADCVYFRGGDTNLLKDILKPIKNLKNYFDGKIIAGSSAGFIVFAKYYFDQDYSAIQKGLDFLPIKAMSHYGLPNSYGESFEKELDELRKYRKEENLETIALRETEYIIRESKR